ncbi:hypothetical protein FH972_012235 [Carpinus fangiana]|uniref:Uncharacterized protein n=1 Tax=Carpinus fangiana TaxID=176857 RepID=A0A5N6R5J4_9ROSI|nr:hypothetical protein FH972_012235 [Carpinus fangiana]
MHNINKVDKKHSIGAPVPRLLLLYVWLRTVKKGVAKWRFVDGGLTLAMTKRWGYGCLWVAAWSGKAPVEGGRRVYAGGGSRVVSETMVKTGGGTTEVDNCLDLGRGSVFGNF